MKGHGFDARGVAQVGLGAALIAVCAWVSVPLPPPLAPFTLQTFAVCLVCAVYGWKPGFWSVAVYILLGAVGVPVFSGVRGGIGVLLGTTGGYIAGFLLTALIVGLAADRFGRRLPVMLAAMALGVLACYAFGTAWFVAVYTYSSGPVGIMTALGWCVFPYLVPDALKIAAAALLAKRLHGAAGKLMVKA